MELAALADACERLSVAFAYPSPEFARGLLDGSFNADLGACIAELAALRRPEGGVGSPAPAVTAGEAPALTAPGGLAAVGATAGEAPGGPAAAGAMAEDAPQLLERLRREYSRLYLQPGYNAPIYPYEGAFLHVEQGLEGAPTLFINVAAQDVEAVMRMAGVGPGAQGLGAAVEPADRIDKELDLLRLLCTNALLALEQGRQGDAVEWQSEANRFKERHLDNWLPAFMRETAAKARLEEYRQWARWALRIWELSS
jgi:TorA maturation chaperone TorD